jgi:ATPase subunit of ABC transporter with duplicated ATPase domains
MSILRINKLSHTYDEKVLFKDADLIINNGEHVGIVGLNGAGKSTFINIIAHNISQDAGEVIWLNGIRYGYLDQHADIDRSLTVMEYLRTAFAHLYELDAKLQKLYEDMGTVEDMDVLDKMITKSNRMLEQLTSAGFYDIESQIKKVANGLGVNAFGYDTVISTLSGGQRAKLMLSKLILEDLDVMLLDEPTNFLDVEHIE